ncbi:MAG: flagellar hook protein FlgE [Caulobacter sp.]|nr:flagellar hook protein FlgE [Caulobacter sp.]
MQVLNTATAGLMAASQRLDASARRTAAWGADAQVDLAKEAVEQITARTDFKANLSVIRTADEMMGELLDILA